MVIHGGWHGYKMHFLYSFILICVIQKGFLFWIWHGKDQAPHLLLTEFSNCPIIPDGINIHSSIILCTKVNFRSIYSSNACIYLCVNLCSLPILDMDACQTLICNFVSGFEDVFKRYMAKGIKTETVVLSNVNSKYEKLPSKQLPIFHYHFHFV